LKKKGNGTDEKTKNTQKKHIVRVTLLESFDLGKSYWTKGGKRPTTLSLSWSEFADLLAKKIEEDRK
jgi:hypothetical protein